MTKKEEKKCGETFMNHGSGPNRTGFVYINNFTHLHLEWKADADPPLPSLSTSL
jgi:hypothetical protein